LFGWVAIGTAGVMFVSGSLVVNAAMPAEQPGALVWPHLVHRGIAVLAGIALLTFSMRPGAALPYAEPVRWPPPLASRAP
jgi:hypothetical protein